MRHLHLLLLACTLRLLLPATAAAAPAPPDTTQSPLISRLPADGLPLTNGWRYHAGDNPAWARPDFDDRSWETVRPGQARKTLPGLSRGIGWLRLRLRLSDSLRQHELLLKVRDLTGAAEVYLNGRLVLRQGTSSADPKRVRPLGYSPEPIELLAGGPAEQVVAIRYAPWQPPLLQGIGETSTFKIDLLTARQLREWETRRASTGLIFFVMGCLFALLTLFHLAFYYYNPSRRANLYFAGYALALSLASLGFYFSTRLPFSTLLAQTIFRIGIYVLLWLSGMGAVRALYSLFGFPTGRVFTGLALASGLLIGLYATFYYYNNGYIFATVALLLIPLEQLRLTGLAMRRRRRGSRIIGIGYAVTMLTLIGLIGLGFAGISLPGILSQLTYPLTFLPPALGISLFLAREFALDAELLQVKLGEVERLSAQTLAQEQDKQALLARQNETLEQQVQRRTAELQQSLDNLRTTQNQLIQSEKMASLGELTAGIAHEIQNPLNFVTNFADVSAELVQELQEAQAANDAEEVSALADDLQQNLTKIHQHGQRAASIVRGMLEHSRASSGERAPTNLNALCDEYLRLAYHGLRAKNKSFNATLETDFAPDLPSVEAVGADLGRVLLNLFTNAFYAVQQRQQLGEAGYAPAVTVTTRAQSGGGVEIRVRDNGTGIPESARQKIFQPFFTTKPAGEGTGLGLSLSYDIISKGHNGTLQVETQEGQGTEFIISLPG